MITEEEYNENAKRIRSRLRYENRIKRELEWSSPRTEFDELKEEIKRHKNPSDYNYE